MSFFRCGELYHKWSVEKTDLGVKRTCKLCGLSITEVGRPTLSPLDMEFKEQRIKGKHYKNKS